MLGLQLPTDPRWVDIAKKNLAEILIDHAYCEQKAASTCISLISTYPEKEELVNTLRPVVAEEWDHFNQVLDKMQARSIPLGRQRKDEYVIALNKLKRKGVAREVELMDKLLICALIEARSCERFRILSEEIQDQDLSQWYYELMRSEANHYMNFVKLAKTYNPAETVDQRLQEFLAAEAEIIRGLEPRADRVH